MKTRKTPLADVCPCGSGRGFADCCGPYLAGTAAPTAEALMRSRYTAYVRMDEAYLLATWHAGTRPARLDLEPTRWIGLTVRRHEMQDADHAVVEFVARYKVGGRAHLLHETSRFVRADGRWFYVDGETG
ncbi:MAG: YchJ family metal-binding protein [Pseudomonadota bacterium]